MYHYIYESFLTDPKFAKQLNGVENRLTDLGIYGSVHRLALFKTMKGTVQDAVRRGAKTIVAVGSDEAVAKAIDAVAEFPGVTFGIIPFGEKRAIADILGISDAMSACDILSARLVEELDLGKVNGHYFLTSLHVPGSAMAECDGRYVVSPIGGGEICVSNFAVDRDLGDPRDGRLETTVQTASRGLLKTLFGKASRGLSVFKTKKVVVRSREGGQLAATADGQPYQDAEFRVEVMPRHLKVIVGKGRNI